ncbi:MAG: DNA alkylation repair protein [Paracoccaceae bacterium]
MTPLKQLGAIGNPQKAVEMARYHKVERPYLGVSNPDIYDLCKQWRAGSDLDGRLKIAADLWDSNVHEARIAATKLLTQARIRPDDTVWIEITRWVEGFDAWAIADHACSAGSRRLVSDPSRLDIVENWTTDENMWVRRAAMVMTLPWTKQNHPSEADRAIRERVLGWAVTYTQDHDWFIQKSVSWWLRSLSGHNPDRVRTFISDHGDKMKPFALKDATRKLC